MRSTKPEDIFTFLIAFDEYRERMRELGVRTALGSCIKIETHTALLRHYRLVSVQELELEESLETLAGLSNKET